MKKTKYTNKIILLIFTLFFISTKIYSQNINIFTADHSQYLTNIEANKDKVKMTEPPSIISYPEKEKSKSSFVEFMQGRNSISINFSPFLYANLVGPIFSVTDSLFGLSTRVINDQIGDIASNANLANYTILHDASKTFDFAISFGYDFKVLNNITVSADFGFGFFDFSLNKYYARFRTIYWSIGTKIFPSYKAPYGFFIFPKIGGTDVVFTGAIDKRPVINKEKGQSTSFHSHGVYISAEIGWRIQMFAKKAIKWPVKVSFDISVLDIGYYINPWSRPIMVNMGDLGKQIERNLKFFADIRFIPIPRIGFTISF